jgi:thiamine pyrophosphate-dependent acetolactate synthase large subunit-like protein
MNVTEAFGIIDEHYDRQLVVTGTGTATQEWHRRHGPWDDDAFHVHTMGLTSSFALGLAVAQPDRQVWAFEGDGGLVMNFGTLTTYSEYRPPNLRYFLVSNRRHRTIEGPPIPAADHLDYEQLGRGLGLEGQVVSFDDTEVLSKELPSVLADDRFMLIVLEVGPERPAENPKPKAPYEAAEIKYRFARYIERETGARVFGKLGY